jgi:hypothetical protein
MNTGVIILISLLLIFHIRFIINALNTKDKYSDSPKNKVLLSDVYHTLKTGDIILYKSIKSSLIYTAFYPSNLYKHIGMILVLDNNIYVTESTNSDFYKYDDEGNIQRMKSGVNIVPFLTRAKFYNGYIYMCKLSHDLSVKMEELLFNAVDKVKDYTYPSKANMYTSFIFNVTFSKKFYCYEYIYYLLYSIGLIDKKNPVALDMVNMLNNLDELECNLGYSYHSPNNIICNVLDVVYEERT